MGKQVAFEQKISTMTCGTPKTRGGATLDLGDSPVSLPTSVQRLFLSLRASPPLLFSAPSTLTTAWQLLIETLERQLRSSFSCTEKGFEEEGLKHVNGPEASEGFWGLGWTLYVSRCRMHWRLRAYTQAPQPKHLAYMPKRNTGCSDRIGTRRFYAKKSVPIEYEPGILGL